MNKYNAKTIFWLKSSQYNVKSKIIFLHIDFVQKYLRLAILFWDTKNNDTYKKDNYEAYFFFVILIYKKPEVQEWQDNIAFCNIFPKSRNLYGEKIYTDALVFTG